MNDEQLFKAEIVSDLLKYEKDEANLISLYRTLLDVGMIDCLPDKEKKTFKETLEILLRDSEKHLTMIAGLAKKFNKEF